MVESKGENARIYMLDYIKAVCIILVIIQHSEIYSTSGNVLLMPFWVSVCVPCFIMVSGFTLSVRFEHRDSSMKMYYRGLLRDVLHVLIPYTISALLIVLMKLFFSDSVLTVKDILTGYLTGSIGTGGYFIIVYLQLLLIFPIINLRVSKKGIKGLIPVFAVNIFFEFVIMILKQNDVQVYEFYKLCSIRYFALLAVGCFLYYHRDWKVSVPKTASLVWGGLFVYAYAYLELEMPCAPYWQHSNFFICLYLYPIMCFLLEKGKNLRNINIYEKSLSFIGRASLYIFSVQMAWFTNSHSWNLFGLPKETMWFVDCVICVAVGVVFYYIVEVMLMGKKFFRQRR